MAAPDTSPGFRGAEGVLSRRSRNDEEREQLMERSMPEQEKKFTTTTFSSRACRKPSGNEARAPASSASHLQLAEDHVLMLRTASTGPSVREEDFTP
ncbi:hypothetical protein EVG20_g3579 [Dentipellis fragilis]|uniref:Uncharacterized protein n=1 Tax=Dentipellis fragilis TaxID=205917 RepID=A0A4Y9Z3A3_9AGAM|nr:hypothetical protein EVG20_g3579 [Dentipellis fragilis]